MRAAEGVWRRRIKVMQREHREHEEEKENRGTNAADDDNSHLGTGEAAVSRGLERGSQQQHAVARCTIPRELKQCWDIEHC